MRPDWFESAAALSDAFTMPIAAIAETNPTATILLTLIAPLLLFVKYPLFDDDLTLAGRSEQLSCAFVAERQFCKTAQNKRIFQIAH